MKRLGILALLLTGCAAFDRTEPSALSGTIQEYPEGTPVKGALVRVVGTDRTIAADAFGRFKVGDLGASASLQFWAPGHAIATRRFRLLPGEERALDVPLPDEGETIPVSWVLFERSGRIWSVDSLGSDERCLTPELDGTQVSPTWLAGKSQFAFIQRIPGRTQVWSRYPDGRPARYIAELPDSAAELRWHPLGNMFVYASTYYSPSRGMVTALRSLDFNSGVQQELVSGAAEANPAWSADGHQLVWARRTAPKPWQIWMAGPRGERPHPFAGRGSCVEPAFSPSGSQLAFASNAAGNWDLYVAGVGTGLSEPLTDVPAGGWCRRPVWSETGDEILFESNYHPGLKKRLETPGLFAVRLSTHAVRAIVTDARAGTW
ncbi:MAG TPA: carboxypeptidase regulatory-like domain-containing protein [Stenomitos sp.]